MAITLSEAIRDGENAVDALTREDFEEEIQHIEKMFGLFFRIFKFFAKNSGEILTEHDYTKWSIVLLFLRNLRVLRCVHRSMLNGYYDVSVAMLRMAFENHLLMYFFLNREDEARKWWSGKRFTPKFLKKEVRESLSYDKVYRSLSELIHTNFKVTRFFSEPRGEDLAVWITNYDSARFYQTLHGLLTFGAATLMVTPMAFRDEFKIKHLVKEISEFVSLNKLILKSAQKKSLEKKKE